MLLAAGFRTFQPETSTRTILLLERGIEREFGNVRVTRIYKF
jgi:hypothetical protein